MTPVDRTLHVTRTRSQPSMVLLPPSAFTAETQTSLVPIVAGKVTSKPWLSP